MFGIISLALAAGAAGPATTTPDPAAPASVIAAWVRGNAAERPRINLWLDRDDLYERGDRARVYFRSDVDAYVTVVRIDTDGRVRVLFPIDPWEDNWARGGRTFEVLGRSRDEAFRVDDYPGLGYIFAIASEDPFTYDDIVRGDHWDYRAISDGRVRGDPYVAVSELADRIAIDGGYDYDVVSYSVERHYDYPRFVCYDCHTYASWRYWDPYHSYCSRFRIVIYDDWYYYPYRYYRGGVVVVRPYRPGPRYVFKDYDGRNDYVTRVATRNRDDGRRTYERDRTSADVGGRGSIPAPVSPRRRTPEGRSAPSAEPSRTPDTRRPADRPRERTGETRREPQGGQAEPRDARPDPESSPRRRPSPRGESSQLRDTERQGPSSGATRPDEPSRRPRETTEPSRRAPETGRTETARPRAGEPRSGVREAPSDRAPRAEPNRDSGPSRRTEPSRGSDAPRAEPSRGSGASRAEPSRGSGSPRAEPSRGSGSSRAEPSRGSGQPRSTGNPELKRRRPN